MVDIRSSGADRRGRERSRLGLVVVKSTGSWPRCPASSALSSRSSKYSVLSLRHAPHIQPRQTPPPYTSSCWASDIACGGSSHAPPHPTAAPPCARVTPSPACTAVRRAGRWGRSYPTPPTAGVAPQRHHRVLLPPRNRPGTRRFSPKHGGRRQYNHGQYTHRGLCQIIAQSFPHTFGND